MNGIRYLRRREKLASRARVELRSVLRAWREGERVGGEESEDVFSGEDTGQSNGSESAAGSQKECLPPHGRATANSTCKGHRMVVSGSARTAVSHRSLRQPALGGLEGFAFLPILDGSGLDRKPGPREEGGAGAEAGPREGPAGRERWPAASPAPTCVSRSARA
ncbi:hypothetical protein HPG69_015102 [Diceros bicornis minor]|uniref:Uncharacterized protein n=1 Tax=Diceros bicornis minor TaxID=77932 RepID=A0A7J7FLC7_DICBM|nr:hypothetical protein HPG69_015102 [Diceros bicornis minor]